MSKFVLITKIALTSILLWLVLRQVDFGDAVDNIVSFTVLGLIGVFLLLTLQQFVAACRLHVVMQMLHAPLTLLTALRINLIGFFFGQTFLSFLGGDAARLWEMNKENVGLQAATSGVLLDRLLGFIANHILVLIMLPWTLVLVQEQTPRLAVMLVALGGIGGIALVVMLAWMHGVLRIEERLGETIPGRRIILAVLDLAAVLRVSFREPGRAARVLALGLVINALNAVMIYFLFADMGTDITLTQCLALVPLIMELALMPVSIAGWGVREGLMVVAFGMAGVTAGAAFSVSILFGLISVVFGLFGCAVWLSQRSQQTIQVS